MKIGTGFIKTKGSFCNSNNYTLSEIGISGAVTYITQYNTDKSKQKYITK